MVLAFTVSNRCAVKCGLAYGSFTLVYFLSRFNFIEISYEKSNSNPLVDKGVMIWPKIKEVVRTRKL